MQKKEVLAEVDPEPTPRECRICLGGDEEGEEWVAPCHCPRAFVWVHCSCIEWRLKHTRIDEDKLRCAACKFPYQRRLRLKSLREWYHGWRDGEELLRMDAVVLIYACIALLAFRDGEFFYCAYIVFLAAFLIAIHIYAAYRWPARVGLSLYKRLLAVAVRDRVVDAPSPPRSSLSATP